MSGMTPNKSGDDNIGFKRAIVKKTYAILSILTLLTIAQPAYASKLNGNDLLKLCARNAKGGEVVPHGHYMCQSYIAGILDYQNFQISLGNPPTVQICVPEKEPLKRLQDVIYAYLYKNKQHDGFTAAGAVITALYEYYPCKVRKKRIHCLKRSKTAMPS